MVYALVSVYGQKIRCPKAQQRHVKKEIQRILGPPGGNAAALRAAVRKVWAQMKFGQAIEPSPEPFWASQGGPRKAKDDANDSYPASCQPLVALEQSWSNSIPATGGILGAQSAPVTPSPKHPHSLTPLAKHTLEARGPCLPNMADLECCKGTEMPPTINYPVNAPLGELTSSNVAEPGSQEFPSRLENTSKSCTPEGSHLSRVEGTSAPGKESQPLVAKGQPLVAKKKQALRKTSGDCNQGNDAKPGDVFRSSPSQGGRLGLNRSGSYQARSLPPAEEAMMELLTASAFQFLSPDFAAAFGQATAEKPQMIEFMELLGKGSFGKVYKACCSNKSFAVKVLPRDPSQPNLENDEFKMLALLGKGKENIIQCWGLLVTNFNFQILLELYEMDLWKRLKRGPPFNHSDAKEVCRCLVRGVQYMHSLGCVHRDLKPANVMFTSQPLAAYISDLGAATARQGDKARVTTRAYRAPEVHLGHGFRFPADVWSLGLVCAELEGFGFLPENPKDSKDTVMQTFYAMLAIKLGSLRAPVRWECNALLNIKVFDGGPTILGKKFQKHFQDFIASMLQFHPLNRQKGDQLLLSTWLAVA